MAGFIQMKNHIILKMQKLNKKTAIVSAAYFIKSMTEKELRKIKKEVLNCKKCLRYFLDILANPPTIYDRKRSSSKKIFEGT